MQSGKNCFAGLSVLAASVFLASAVAAESSLQEEVIVTLPIHGDQASSALSLEVLAGEELQRLSANTIGETLARLPGISSSSFGPSVGRPVIRGQSGARVLVLQNSTGSSDVSSVSPDHLVTVEPVLAESVEVLRGPSTLLYSGAIGGVVNVIDKRIPLAKVDGLQGELELRHGSVNDESTAVISLDSGNDKGVIHVDGLWRESNDINIDGSAIKSGLAPAANTSGKVANTAADAESYTMGGSLFLDNGLVGFAVNQQENEYGVPATGEQLDEGEFIQIDAEQTRYDLRTVLDFSGHWLEQLRGWLTYTDYEHTEIEDGEAATEWSNEVTELRVEAQHGESNGFHGAFGLQAAGREFAAEGEESYVPAADIQRWGVFVVEDYHFEDVKLEAGLRYDRTEVDLQDSSESANFDTFSVSASALWQLDDNWRTGFVLASAERAPEVEELYADGPHLAVGIVERGDADLDSETALNAEWSLGYERDAVAASLTVYHKQFDDYIYLRDTGVVDVDGPVFAYSQQDADFSGAELEIEFPLASFAGGELGAKVFGDLVRGELDNGDDIPRLPPRRIGLELGYERNRVGTVLSVIDAADQDDPGENERDTDGYTRVDLSVDFSFQPVDGQDALLFLRAKNLTDEEIRNSVSFLRDIAPEPGRSIEAGLRYKF